MSCIFDPISPKLSRTVNLVDSVLCTWVHNPIVAVVFIAPIAVYITLKLVVFAAGGHGANFLNTQSLVLDIMHNLVNLLFIIRFPATAKTKLLVESTLPAEIALFVVQNAGAFVILTCPSVSLLYSQMHYVLKVFLLWQMFCPFLTMTLSVIESLLAKKEVLEKETRTSRVRAILVDTNNTFLPVFIAHSFATVNVDFPFAVNLWVLLLYKWACFSLKMYLILRFVLYELVVVLNDMTDSKSYAEFYIPVSIGAKESGWYDRVARHTKDILVLITAILVGLDVGMLAINSITY